jgi:hypothetical protein
MARIAAGIDLPTAQEPQPLAEDPAWECQVEAMAVILPNAIALPNLTEVRVHVRPAAEIGPMENRQATTGQEKPWYTLARWITLRGDASKAGPAGPTTLRNQSEAVFRPAVP